MKSKRILITGATGFVGSYLTRYLVQQGYSNIVAMKRPTSNMDMVQEVVDKVAWAKGDVLDVPFLEGILRGVDWVFHCAAVVSYDPRDREEMYKINAEGTANVVNIALDNEVEKLVHMSSIAAIGRDKREPNLSENTKWIRSELNTHYAISKYQAEQEVWRGIAEGLNAAIVNPSVIIGSQNWKQGTGKLFTQVNDGLRFYTEGATGYVDVRDVVRFMLLLMESPIENQRFILNAENWTYKKPVNIAVTPLLRQIAWRVEWLKSKFTGNRPLITKETAKVSATTFYFDNQKSLNAFPSFSYSPVKKVIEETGNQFLESQKMNKNYACLKF